jgi:sporulation protein YlmC with PRC-barrel domain
MKESTRFVPTNKLKEYDVVDKNGEGMGKVRTFVIDMLFGRIAFAMVSFGGVFSNDKWFAMPWETLKWSIENKKFSLDMPKEVLEKATGMDKDNWLDQINFEFVGKSYTHFGVAPYWEGSYPRDILSIPKDMHVIGTNQMVSKIGGGEQKNTDSIKESTRFVPTNKLKEYDVFNKKGEAMGEVQTFVVDMLFGRIAFAMVSFGGVFSNDKWFAMPWETLKWSIENKKFILDMPKEVLEKATGMDKNTWLDDINLDFLARSYTHFEVAPYWDSPNLKGTTNPTVIQGVVTPVPTLSFITVMPISPASLAVGSAQKFTASATYSDKIIADVTSKVTWASSNTAIATITLAGLVTGIGIGFANITATMVGVTSPAVTLRTQAARKLSSMS